MSNMNEITVNEPGREALPAEAGRTSAGPYRPRLSFYHANPRGTGCAIDMELHPAHDQTAGSIWLRAANQMTIGDRRGPNPTYARFDWENRIVVKLDFNDLTKMLQVFRGECESINDGKGLYHQSPKASTTIKLRHLIEPIPGYSLELYRSPRTGGEDSHACILLSPAEALGLSEAITGSLSVICFGIPMVIPRDSSAYAAETKEMRHAAA